jgi:hypothetical protein
MATYGQVRVRIKTEFPSIQLDLIDGWIQDRYQEILAHLDWQRTERQASTEVEQEFTLGVVTVQPGSQMVSLDISAGGAFLPKMDGWVMRIAESELFTAAFVDGAFVRLDRAWNGVASQSAFRLNKVFYPVPADCRILNQVRLAGAPYPLTRLTRAELNDWAPDRKQYGKPTHWSQVHDSLIEIYPIPTESGGLVLDYTAELLQAMVASTTLAPWVTPACITAGVRSDCLAFLKDYAGSDRAQRRFEQMRDDMVRTEASQRENARMVRRTRA